ncbi:hypothetical protein H8959_006347 [Pygathrix nigripes]
MERRFLVRNDEQPPTQSPGEGEEVEEREEGPRRWGEGGRGGGRPGSHDDAPESGPGGVLSRRGRRATSDRCAERSQRWSRDLMSKSNRAQSQDIPGT